MIALNEQLKIKTCLLGGEDYLVLPKLYLPLCGVEAYALYMLLQTYHGKDEYVSTNELLDYLHLDSQVTLEYAFQKLEGLGLVKRLENSIGEKIFALQKPLSKKSFLKNDFLKQLLKTNVGDSVCERLKDEGKIRGFVDKSKSFDEVYSVNSKLENIKLKTPDDMKDNIEIKNKNFDYLVFVMLLDDIVPSDVLTCEDIKKELLKISYQYGLSEQEMKDAVKGAIGKSDDFSIEAIKKRAAFINQNKKTMDIFPEKEVTEYTISLTSVEEEIVELAKSKSIEGMLKCVSGGKASQIDIRDYNRLYETCGVKEEVINILIFHLSGMKKDENISYNYIEKVLINWKKANVTDAKSAILLCREKQKEEKKNYKNKIDVKLPEYMNEENRPKDSADDEETKKLADELFGN